MEGRQIRLLGAMGMLLLISLCVGCYAYVMAHYAHFWTLIVNCTLLLSAFFAPAICYGYNAGDALTIPDHMTPERFMKMRDLGYGLALILYAACYIIPPAAWFASNGLGPSMGAVIVIDAGNLCCGLAFIVFARLYIWPGGAEQR